MKPESEVKEHAETWLAYTCHIDHNVSALARGRAAGYLMALKDMLADEAFSRKALCEITRLCSDMPHPAPQAAP